MIRSQRRTAFIRIFFLLAALFTFHSMTVSASDIEYYAHRGYVRSYPENSLPAFEAAMKKGFDGIEFDVYQTSGTNLMVYHDATLNRTCKVDGSIYSVTAKNRKKYPIKAGKNISKFTRDPLMIPTFEETVAAMSKKKAFLYINLKGCGRYTQSGVKKMYKILKKYKMHKKCVIFCGSYSLMERFDKLGLATGYLDTANSQQAAYDHLNTAIDKGIQTYVMFNPSYINKTVIKRCQKHGISIGAYKVTSKSAAKRIEKLGVDFMFIYTDKTSYKPS